MMGGLVLLCVVVMEMDEMLVLCVAVPKGFKIWWWSGHRGGTGADAHDQLKHLDGCLVDEEGPNIDAWHSRRPLTIDFRILTCSNKHKHGLGCLQHQEALIMEAWHSRRPLTTC